MKKFELSGKAVFFAEDLDDAFGLLAKHFKALSTGEETHLFDAGTDIHLVKVSEEELAQVT
jgi:hypothetical protein